MSGADGRRIILSPAEIDRWMQGAQAGDELIYGRCADLPAGAKGPAFIAACEKEGLVKISTRPAKFAGDPPMTEYVARRTGQKADTHEAKGPSGTSVVENEHKKGMEA
jgi:hypothetical protein